MAAHQCPLSLPCLSLIFSPTKQPDSKVGNSRMCWYENAVFTSNFVLTRRFELVTRGLELLTRRFELVTRRFEPVTRGFKLATRNSYFTFPRSYHAKIFLVN